MLFTEQQVAWPSLGWTPATFLHGSQQSPGILCSRASSSVLSISELIPCIQAGPELPDQTPLWNELEFFFCNGSSTLTIANSFAHNLRPTLGRKGKAGTSVQDI